MLGNIIIIILKDTVLLNVKTTSASGAIILFLQAVSQHEQKTSHEMSTQQ